jgi:hypothetical protein
MMPPARRFFEILDIGVALALALVGTFAVGAFDDGSTARVVLVAPILLFAPGYLLLQALLVPARSARTRLLHGVLSIGISLAVVGLVSLTAAVVRGGFRPAVIVALVTLTCIALAATATYRRLYQRAPLVTAPDASTPRIQGVPVAASRPMRRPEEPAEAIRSEPTMQLPIVTAIAETSAPEESAAVAGPAMVAQRESR